MSRWLDSGWRWHVCVLAGLAVGLARAGTPVRRSESMTPQVSENTYVGELMRFPGPYGFWIGKAGAILTTDEELVTLARDPERVIDLSLTFDKRTDSLRSICERAQAAGQRTLVLSFDHFFKQYRPGTNEPRRLMPDTEEYIGHIAAISRFAADYGLALELSLLSPLEIGPGYQRQTGESGLWMHYRKGLRDPVTGVYSVQLWRQLQWCNNKGPVAIAGAGVRVFAFRESPVPGTPYLAVNPGEIVEISDTAEVEEWEGAVRRHGDYRAQRIRVHGRGRTDAGPLDRVLVVQVYRTPEMDYFSDRALPFLEALADRYVDAGVRFHALYSDEMHIQQDWGYFSHHDHGELALRYVSDGLRRRFAALYGAEYEDLARYLVYFCRGQEDTRDDTRAKEGTMHVFGASPEDIRRTALFRARYYGLLQDGVVDLFVAAKRHLEGRMGYRLDTRAHATWAESPTIDRWETGHDHHPRNQYEYTSNFVWSNTVHQAASACHDYFKWGEYLTGTGNDHAECGWLDRNYYGLALGCSTGIVNEVPYSYAAHWGSPREVADRRSWLQAVYGAAGSPVHGMVQGLEHRDVEVLMLYPLDLVSVDERFGSWMTQYGYANYLTSAKLIELGRVREGAIEVAGRRFPTLVALFEPHPPPKLLTLMRDLAEAGGRVIWSATPPLLAADGSHCLDEWRELFGVDVTPAADMGWLVPGRLVAFEGALGGIPPMPILTDLLPDRVYAVAPRPGTEVLARVQGKVAGALRLTPAGGRFCFLGFRPRDDQSQSLGYDARWWFDILDALGAYPATGRFEGVNDNAEVLSRTGPWLCCRFPNGAVSVARHLHTYAESWPGGFGRKEDADRRILEANPPPPREIRLDGLRIAGHTVTYDGHGPLTFRVGPGGSLVGFAGHQC
ncbi:MAG: hypothetical protein JXR77_03090, partial [Lentisphaeria bacterium]|nr:hypothetical protein [Lentisphaeria bacterium]